MTEGMHVLSLHACKSHQRLPLPLTVHRVENFAIGFLHKWIRAFLVLVGAPRHDIFPPFASTKDSLLHRLLTKSGSKEITRMLHGNNLLPNTVDYLSPCEVGGSHKCSDEAKAKISQSLMGRECSDEHKAKISQSLMGRELSDEHKAKISQSLMGRELADEHDGEIKKVWKKHSCKHDGCNKWSRNGGFCGEHGGKRREQSCKHDGCKKWPQSGGFCSAHGGKNSCKHDGCEKWTVSGGFCCKHGRGKRKAPEMLDCKA